MNTAKKALAYAQSQLGAPYSQENRWGENPNTFDCSSLVYRAFLEAGYPFFTGSTTDQEVYDGAFDLLWPYSYGAICQENTSVQALKRRGYQAQPGDLIFFHTADTQRPNGITHVAIVESPDTMIHARGTDFGVVRTPIDLYDDKVKAVTRYHAVPAGKPV